MRYLILAILLLAAFADAASIPLVRYGSNTPVYLKNGNGIVVSNDGTVSATGVAASIKGQYAAGTAYVAGDIVGYQGQSWVALKATTGNSPVEGLNWTLFADKGATGATGASPEIHSVFDAPAAEVGKDGDWAFDTSIEAKVFKRVAGTWNLVNSIRGPAGANGTDGVNGTDGADGANGSNGIGISIGSDGTYGWYTNTNTTVYTECAAGRYGLNWIGGKLFKCTNGSNTEFTVPAETTTGGGGYVAAPTYSNDPCTVGEWSTSGGYHYTCIAPNQWDRIAYASWSNPNVQACTEVFTSSTVATDTIPVDQTATNKYAGILITGAGTNSICSFTVRVGAAVGTRTSYNYTAYVYSRTGTAINLSDLKATSSSINGATMITGDEYTFTFSPPVSITTGDVIVITHDQAASTAAAISLSRSTSDVDGSFSQQALYNSDGTVYSTAASYELYYKLVR